jgi:ATP-binding cassette subfamily A (ABC1) protein 3
MWKRFKELEILTVEGSSSLSRNNNRGARARGGQSWFASMPKMKLSMSGDLPKLFLFPAMVFILVILLYENMKSLFDGQITIINYGFFEIFLIPIGFWVLIIKTSEYIMTEKTKKLKESMLMMGLKETPYYLSIYITEAIIIGFVLSLFLALFSLYPHFFNNADFGSVFAVFFCYCLSAVPFAICFCYFITDMRMASIGIFLTLFGFYAIFAGILFTAPSDMNKPDDNPRGCLLASSLVPPLGLQVAFASWAYKHYSMNSIYFNDDGEAVPYTYTVIDNTWPPTQDICGMMLTGGLIFAFIPIVIDFCLKQYNLMITNSIMQEQLNTLSPVHEEGENNDMEGSGEDKDGIYIEKISDSLFGKPTVVLNKLKKTFSNGQVAVNNLSLQMYEHQIFALLGHNGAGKTTTINMLTGALTPDKCDANTGASIYGHSIHKDMDSVHNLLGVCPQHDVLFENLSVLDHMVFFSMLKGFTYEHALTEAMGFAKTFHLEKRMRHHGGELSGGQKRKLSVAIALCGGSKFIVLDEPTAGMDPLARRELWDLLASLRQGRTILLTTHYMDETNVLGDRTAIINLGGLACMGSNSYLKKRLGAGYRLIFDVNTGNADDTENNTTDASSNSTSGITREQRLALDKFVKEWIPTAELKIPPGADPDIYLSGGGIGGVESEGNSGKMAPVDYRSNDMQMTSGNEKSGEQIQYTLPFNTVHIFGRFFQSLGSKESMKDTYNVCDVGMNIADLEEVFLKVGGDHSVKPLDTHQGIGSVSKYTPTLTSQIYAITYRRLMVAKNDPMTIPILGFPLAAIIGAAVLISINPEIIKGNQSANKVFLSFCVSAMYFAGFMMVPGFIGDFLVLERERRLRNVLTVMGCDFKAFWIGNFLADFMMLSLPVVGMFISWAAADMENYYKGVSGAEGASFFLVLIFVADVIAFSYLFSFFFQMPSVCGAFMPLIILGLFILPIVLIFIGIVINNQLLGRHEVNTDVMLGSLLWGVALFTPHGTLLTALMDTTSDFAGLIKQFPPYQACITIMIVEFCLYMLGSFYLDSLTVLPLTPKSDPRFTDRDQKLATLHKDVVAERQRTLNAEIGTNPLEIHCLRKVFPSKAGIKGKDIVATEDVAFSVEKGECFGLLGANGAGKSTTISMITRHLEPTAGDAIVRKVSVLQDFIGAAQNLGVVTQTNSLWDLLSVKDHLYLFGRLRGVTEDIIDEVVNSTIDQMELTPHKDKLSYRLSGGMKRKLCVAISLIGDPAVVLLDEPSAGLDPMSRRNLWDVILRTMKHRSVVLTTHSLEEAEALCDRIGIMVKGQLRVLGTKQHLKNTFGNGFELAIKLNLDAPPSPSGSGSGNDSTGISTPIVSKHEEERINALMATTKSKHSHSKSPTKDKIPSASAPMGKNKSLDSLLGELDFFIKSHFPSATLISNNGGVFPMYRIKREEMDLGLAFGQLEEKRVSLCIEEYSISQPTLEQVFIRTVNDYTPGLKEAQQAGKLIRTSMSMRQSLSGGITPSTISPLQSSDTYDEKPVTGHPIDEGTVEGALSLRLSRSGSLSGKLDDSSRMSITAALELMEAEEEEDQENAAMADLNKCGCSSTYIKQATAFFCFMTIFWGFMWISASIGGHRTLGITSFLLTFVSIVTCCAHCCTTVCCKKGGMEEGR